MFVFPNSVAAIGEQIIQRLTNRRAVLDVATRVLDHAQITTELGLLEEVYFRDQGRVPLELSPSHNGVC